MINEQHIQILLQRSKQGDREAFGQIYDIYSQRLFNFLVSKLRHKQTAEDLLQTVFLKAWSNLYKYEPRPSAKFSTWLYQIANYTLIDHWRTKKDTADLNSIDNLAVFAEDSQLYEEYQYLHESLSKLPIEYQVVLDLRFRQQLSVSETADIMNKTEIGVRVAQHRALKMLKAILNTKGITSI